MSLLVVNTPASALEDEPMESDELLDLSIEELMDLPVEVTTSLTKATRRMSPSTITTITQEDIRNSSARDLDELLDIYVPNYQRMHDYYEFRKGGLRGINSDRDDKYLILVNGRIMNEHTHYGAISERDLPMLSDIHHVDVIRGPGSSLYGPGAVAMVINIITENAMTFEGSEVTVRGGFIENFFSGELKHTWKFSEESGLYVYAGVSHYDGGDKDDTPIVLGMPDYSIPHVESQPHLNEAWRNELKWKLYTQYTYEDFNVWLRYTNGGVQRAKLYWMDWALGEEAPNQGDGYQQFTVFAGNTNELSDSWMLNYYLSFDMMDYEKSVWNDLYSHSEHEYMGRILATWTPHEDHSLAFGGEASYEQFGKQSPGWPNQPPSDWTHAIYGLEMNDWYTYLLSLLAEYQWNMSEQWTTFLGGRFDYHTFTEDMFSPRATLVYMPTEKDTAKLIYARSVRTGQAADMKVTDIYGENTDPEKIDAFELRYERQQTDSFWLAGSAFYHNHDLTGYDFSAGLTTALGNMETWGVELEATYKTEDTRLTFSHGFTKLIDWDPEDGVNDAISAQPLGYGDDLANWSNHITKATLHQKLVEKLSLDTSLRVYWGYPGFYDYAKWVRDNYSVEISKSQFETALFFNLGLAYDFNENLRLALMGHDLFGFIDDDLNKRLYGYYLEGDTRSLAPSVSFTLSYKF